jgi:hypothetical protein
MHRGVARVDADHHRGVPVAVGAVHHAGYPRVRAGARTGQQAVAGDQLLDRAGRPHRSPGEHDHPVADPFQLGDHVRGDDDGQGVVGDGGHQPAHEVEPRDRVEAGDRLVEHQQRRPLGQRHRQRDLRLLAAGQGLDLAFERDTEPGHAPLGRLLIPGRFMQRPRWNMSVTLKSWYSG